MNFYKGLQFPFVAQVSDGHKRTHVPRYYGIQFNESGPLHLRIGSHKEKTYTGAWVFITHPAAEFSYEIPGPVHHNYWAVCFTGPRVRQYLKNGLLSLAARAYPIHDPERFRRTIHELYVMRKREQYDFCVLLLENLLLQLHLPTRHSPAAGLSPWQSETLRALGEAVRDNPLKKWNFDSEARKLHVTPRHFRTLFSSVNGLPPGHFLLKERLSHAAADLLNTSDSVSMIAFKNGFHDEFYFSRLFRKYYLLAPKYYRQEFRSQPAGFKHAAAESE